jgi:acylaminoacyl-peptidase
MSRRKITIEDLRRFRFVSDPQVSPDGGKVAFVLSTIIRKEDRYERHIWLADTRSGKTVQFTHGVGRDTYPRWSPDGKSLLFLSSSRDPDEKKAQLWVIPRTGGEASMVARTDEGVSKPAWAPDSKRMLFLSRVWTHGKPESDVKVVRRIKYKLNGVGTFEGRRTHLFTVRPSRKSRQLTKGEFDVEVARWAPDGKGITFVSNMEEDADISRVGDIYIVPAKGGELTKLTESRHVISDLSWSPDGCRIAFIGHDKPEGLAVNNDLWVMDAGGGEKRNLTKYFDRSLGIGVGCDVRVSTPNPGAVWGPDGEVLYFVTASTPHSNIYRVGAEGGLVEEVVSEKTVGRMGLVRGGSQGSTTGS